MSPGRRAVVGAALLLTICPGLAGAQPAAPVPCAAPAAGIRAWFTADGTGEDRAGSNHGALAGGATFAPGLVGQAFRFDGIDGVFVVPDTPSLIAPQFTVEGWVQLDALDSPGDGSRELVLFIRRSPGNNSGYELLKSPDDAFLFRVTSDAGQPFGAASMTRVVPGRFYHVAGTYDGRAVRLYVDGVLEAETPATATVEQGAALVMMGSSVDSDRRAMKGLLDEMSLYAGALTDEEVRIIHAAGASGKCRERRFLPLTLPGADVGVPYLANVLVDPADALYTFRIAGGTLPAGIAATTGFVGTPGQFGALQGTPTEAGAFDFIVEARNADTAVSAAYTLEVFQCPAPPQELVAWYRAEGTVQDRQGRHHGIPESEGKVSFPPGRVGRALGLNFLGVPVPDAPELNPTTALTLAAWVFPGATSGGPGDPVGTIVVKEGFDGSNLLTQYAIGRRNDVACGSGSGIPTGNLAFVLGGREVVVNDVLTWLSNLPDDCSGWVDAHAPLPLETWSHVALTFDGALVRTYVNGALTREVVSADLLPVTTGRLHIGSRGGRAHWTGLIDETMIFAQALGPAEVGTLIESLDADTCAGPPNRAPKLTVPGPVTSSVLDTITRPVVARDPDLDPLTWRATGLPPDLGIDAATGVISGTVAASAAGDYTAVVFVSDGQAERSGSFPWTVLGPRTVSIGDTSVNRSATASATASFAVTLAPALSTGSATVAYTTTDGTARADVDYVPTSGTLTFAADQTVLTIDVSVPAGSVSTTDKTFFVDLSAPVGAQVGRARGTGTIVAGQTPGPVSVAIMEAIAISDTPGAVPPAAANIAEAIAIADAPGAVPPAVASLVETLAIGDAPGAVPPAVVSIPETLAIADVPGAVPPAVVSIPEALAIADAPGALPPAVVSIAEGVTIADAPGAVPPAVVSIPEALTIGDAPGALPPAVVSIAEGLAIADAPGALPPAVVEISESVEIGDAPGPTSAAPDQRVTANAPVALDLGGVPAEEPRRVR